MYNALPVQPVSQQPSTSSLLWDFGIPREALELCCEVTVWPRSWLRGQSMAPIKGGAKHQLKAQGPAPGSGSRLGLLSHASQSHPAGDSQHELLPNA